MSRFLSAICDISKIAEEIYMKCSDIISSKAVEKILETNSPVRYIVFYCLLMFLLLLGERSETLTNESQLKFWYIYGKVQRGQCVSTPRSYLKKQQH